MSKFPKDKEQNKPTMSCLNEDVRREELCEDLWPVDDEMVKEKEKIRKEADLAEKEEEFVLVDRSDVQF